MHVKTPKQAQKLLVGKTIARIELNPFERGDPEGTICTQPVITFTDGSRITLMTEETEVGEYGTALLYVSGRRKRAPTPRNS